MTYYSSLEFWKNAPDWADKLGRTELGGHIVWLNDAKYAYLDKPAQIYEFNAKDCTVRARSSIKVVANRPSAQWSGQGLPPVGTVCEVYAKYADTYWAKHVGKKAKIIAHCVNSHGDISAVYQVMDAQGYFEYHALVEGNFRPIKTTEQLAAERRAAAINKAAELCGLDGSGYATGMLGKLYDAGLLKGEE